MFYVMRGAEQHPGDGSVHHYANHRNPDHDAGMDWNWIPHPDEGFIEDVKGNCHERECVDKSSQHACAVIAKSFGCTRWAGSE